MRIVQQNWPIRRLYSDRESINLSPFWQRGAAWGAPRQVLLIDSILRGMDIPKVYLRRLPNGGVYAHEAVDGQQRLRAIWEFRSGELTLKYPDPLAEIDGHRVEGLTYPELHESLRRRFNGFEVSIAEITAGTNDEITNLFSRLQMGVSLNPAELRNAIITPMRHVIDAIATTHQFFLESRISDARYKRQDYAAHAFAMAAWRGESDLKAPDLRRLVTEFQSDRADEILALSAEVGDALNVLAQVNELVSYRITQKWIFVDLCWLIMRRNAAGAAVDPLKLAVCYQTFDRRRRQYSSHPEVLIRRGRRDAALDRHLYDYIQAFRTQGGLSANIQIRQEALRAHCPDIDVSL